MFCDHCGSKFHGRINPKRNERLYYCPSKHKSWKQGNVNSENKYKRGKVKGHGCDMKKSLSITLTDHFVWTKELEVIVHEIVHQCFVILNSSCTQRVRKLAAKGRHVYK